MKNFMLGIFFLGFVISGYAQKVIRLDDVTLKASPENYQLDADGSSLIINILESYQGEFYDNPLSFARTKFDIKEFVLANQNKGLDSYDVIFRTNKGNLYIQYDEIGEMIGANQSFKDVALPHSLLMNTVKANEGYRIVGTKHIGKSKGNWTFDQEFYKVKMKNGKKSKNIKINVDRSVTGKIASN